MENKILTSSICIVADLYELHSIQNSDLILYHFFTIPMRYINVQHIADTHVEGIKCEQVCIKAKALQFCKLYVSLNSVHNPEIQCLTKLSLAVAVL